MAVSDNVAAIRNAVYGRDVREAIAAGIEGINTVAENANRSIRYDAAQLGLTDMERAQARSNIGIEIATVAETRTYLGIT